MTISSKILLEKLDDFLDDDKRRELAEAKVTTKKYIDLVNARDGQDIPDSFKPNVPSKKTVKENDDVMLAESDRWGLVEKTDAKKVKVNLNPGMGERPNIVNVPYDEIVAWKYDGSYTYVNKNRIIK